MKAVWVTTEPIIDGSNYTHGYHTVVSFTDDFSLSLTPDDATEYALLLIRAAARAEYDAAVLRQMTVVMAEDPQADSVAALVVTLLRERRKPLDCSKFKPLVVNPIVSATTREGMIQLTLDGENLTQWKPADVYRHANHVLGAPVAAELDGIYGHLITELVDPERASAVVADLANYQDNQ